MSIEMEIEMLRATLKMWKAELAQKKLFLQVFEASGNKSGADMNRDFIFELESKVRMMKEAVKNLEMKPKRKIRSKKRGGK